MCNEPYGHIFLATIKQCLLHFNIDCDEDGNSPLDSLSVMKKGRTRNTTDSSLSSRIELFAIDQSLDPLYGGALPHTQGLSQTAAARVALHLTLSDHLVNPPLPYIVDCGIGSDNSSLALVARLPGCHFTRLDVERVAIALVKQRTGKQL
ncbi:hypothetical protein Naga_100411g3 [Nannochloropsis gaditana]|jgi:hypothetical protein|uniref:Uncharacterized protein n=1 Tax=Nannochloropsis gaditana TaxID=72520 RepID=W7TJQ2_9STRA|nr:hypothetical protein Naga_100411g3 [Nannochloropsis gaditana]